MTRHRSVVGWHRHRIPSAVLAVLAATMGRYLVNDLFPVAMSDLDTDR